MSGPREGGTAGVQVARGMRLCRPVAGGNRIAPQIQVSREGRPGQVLSRMKTGLSGRRILYLSPNTCGEERFSGLAKWFGIQLQSRNIGSSGICAEVEAAISQADSVVFAKSEISGSVRADLRRVCYDNRKMLIALRTASRACFRNAILKLLQDPQTPDTDPKPASRSLELF